MSNQRSNSRTRQLPGRPSTKEAEDYPSRTMKVRKYHRTVISSLVCLMTLLGNFHSASAHEIQRRTELQSNFTYEEPIEPSECLESGEQLLRALKDYYSLEHSNDAAQSYGWPIQTWCVNDWIQELLQKGPLGEGVQDVLEGISISSDNNVVAAGDLISGWIGTAPNQLCLELCAEEENPTGTVNPTNTFTSDGTGSSTLGFEEDSYNLYNTKNVDNYNENIDNSYTEEEEPVSYEPAIDASNSAEHVPNTIQKEKTTTTGMLFRLIPIKLVAILSLMCFVLGLRQMFLHSDGDNCCSKMGNWMGFSSGGHTYQGIDPSDLADQQKSVDFEMLQLAASGDGDLDLDVDIEIS